ncbi:class C sortase [Microbacterium saperdae]|uniref:class C sortase n=1 Tax=Microbacterium saperdae TaxID=69368 RepID=UPI001999CC19|nr:class C sortase [Microbacterium saperdae]GGM59496.1 hypothetical protein GCM10010489_33830 [Microbacterium saperdae]
MNRARARRWRPGLFTSAIAALALGGLLAGLYPMTAQWVSSYNQSLVVDGYHQAVRTADPSAEEQIAQARAYNDALSSGAVRIERNGSRPVSDGAAAGTGFDYDSILSASGDGLMGRVRIPRIDVDLPIYHGTSDAVLARGAGHLEGSHFPIGGVGTRSVITAHRGLADATMFTDLDRVEIGDTFTVEVFERVLTYRVTETVVIEPDAADTIRPVVGEDLVTLITCTPLGINTHRIVVTGERITPTPVADIDAMAGPSGVPGFPWWAVWFGLGLIVIAAYVAQQGFGDARRRARPQAVVRATPSAVVRAHPGAAPS